MADNQKCILVIGAGIIGLTTAIRIAENGDLPVHILADRMASDDLSGEVERDRYTVRS